MAGKSPVEASVEQRGALRALAHSRDRGEADRARAILLTLAGWTSQRIAQAFGGRLRSAPESTSILQPEIQPTSTLRSTRA